MMMSSYWIVVLIFLSHSLTTHSSSLYSPSNNHPHFHLCNTHDSSAFLQFINSFTIEFPPEYLLFYAETLKSKILSWKNGSDCCFWDGVSCDQQSGHVIGLNLTNTYLKGPLHSNSTLFSLHHLQTLILDFNNFYGSPIPSEFGTSFPNLTELSLSSANFSGYIPVQLSHLSKLTHLTVDSYDGDIIVETYVLKRMLQNFTNLRELSLINVNMSNVELLTSFTNISSSLELLLLYLCGLQGKFPENVFRLPNLQQVSLWNNYDVIGSMPTFNWSTPLGYLELSDTKISIDLPYLSKTAKSLNTLNLRNCSFTGSSSSSYPQMFTNLTQLLQLTSLDISHNNFGGHVPFHYLINIQLLFSLDLSGNNFVGEIPEFSKTSNSSQTPLPNHLESLDLSHNLLSGPIPSWIYSLPLLSDLFLSINNLSGPIKEFKSKSLQFLSLGSNKLNGEIPNSIFQQENLSWLDLSYNNLDGVVELSKFSKLTNLHTLDLSFNNFIVHSNNFSNNNPFPRLQQLGLASCNISAFPHFLKSMKNLQILQLSHNQIQGRIPEWLWNNGTSLLNDLNISHNFLTHVEQVPCKYLQSFDLRSNMIHGHLPIVPPSLIFFFISKNNLYGEISSTYCNLSGLQILDISNNNIQGKIPSCLANLSSLSVLDFHKNNFSGEIPQGMFKNLTSLRSLHNCQSLEVLDVGNNKITGTFPYWLEELPKLQVLVLKSNRFHGFMGAPKIKYPFPKLQILDISDNEFSGRLPTKYFRSFKAMMGEYVTSRNLTHIGDKYYQDSVIVVMKGFERELEKIISIFVTIDFSRNNFEGEIPESIGKLKSLKGLNFSQNRLQGSIPMSLINLSNLEGLDLSSNDLSGEIPSKMADLTQLSYLNLSYNKLEGQIPRGNQFDTFNNDSYEGNIKLCGFPLSKSCNTGIKREDDHGEEHTDHISLDWKIVMVGYGCGLIIGISLGYVVLYGERFDYWLHKKIIGRQQQKIEQRRKRNSRLRRRS